MRKAKILVGDFETTVFKGQEYTEVWAAACVELYSEDVKIFHSIDEIYNYLVSLHSNVVIYFHNLKFDGSFWMSYLLTVKKYKQAIYYNEDDPQQNHRTKVSDLENKSFIYSISDMGQWYSITIKENNRIIEIRDSLKLLPFSVEKIGKSFGTKHKKLTMAYEGFRYAGCEITEDEKQYISNDILVIKEALEIMSNEKHTKLTIGACCLSEYKKIFGANLYKEYYPNLYDYKISPIYGCKTAGDYIHNSYRGGWCYVVKEKAKKIYKNGFTADVNSLYPSVMHSESGSRYPIGLPTFWRGDYIPDEALELDKYYFIRIKTRFKIKENYLPFIQAKHTMFYRSNENLETSDIYNKIDGKYYEQYQDKDGNLIPATLTLTMTMTDYILFREHYTVDDFEILDGCYFDSEIGLFDDYINKYKVIKQQSKGAKRELAKLFLNNLYGKMASSTKSSFKVAYIKDDGSIGYFTIEEYNKKPGYIPIGSAITSYARNFTIRAAQKNYYGKDKPGFIYADTDSIHCDLPVEKIKGVNFHSTDFCCWKLESEWDQGYFVRQKTYIEHIVSEDNASVDPYYNIKCAGMPENCKNLFIRSMNGELAAPDEDLSHEERIFLSEKRDITDFDTGLIIPGKLMPKTIKGGVLLVPTLYEMRGI